MSSFQYPRHLLHRVIEPQWFPDRRQETESKYVFPSRFLDHICVPVVVYMHMMCHTYYLHPGMNWTHDCLDLPIVCPCCVSHPFIVIFIVDVGLITVSLGWKQPKKLMFNIYSKS
jgi:hypothetical protein